MTPRFLVHVAQDSDSWGVYIIGRYDNDTSYVTVGVFSRQADAVDHAIKLSQILWGEFVNYDLETWEEKEQES